LNQAGLDLVNSTDYTWFALCYQYDLDDIQPTGRNLLQVNFSEADESKRPYLEFSILVELITPDTTTQTGSTISSHPTLTNGLISHWELDEASGVRYDSHGSNDLTDNGGGFRTSLCHR